MVAILCFLFLFCMVIVFANLVAGSAPDDERREAVVDDADEAADAAEDFLGDVVGTIVTEVICAALDATCNSDDSSSYDD